MSGLPARTGVEWLKQGFGLFRQQPGILTMILFANFMASKFLSYIPVAGAVATVVLIPAFSIAIMQACNVIAQGQRVMPNVLLTGFRQPAMTRLLKLGLVYLAIAIVMIAAIRLTVDMSVFEKMQAEAAARAAKQTSSSMAAPTIPGAMALIVLLWGVAMILLSFATPLTYWKQMPLFKALFYSVFGIIGAFRPVLVMLLTAMLIFMLLTLFISMIFGSSVLMFQAISTWMLMMFTLVMQCAMFACYRQLYADPAPDIKA